MSKLLFAYHFVRLHIRMSFYGGIYKLLFALYRNPNFLSRLGYYLIPKTYAGMVEQRAFKAKTYADFNVELATNDLDSLQTKLNFMENSQASYALIQMEYRLDLAMSTVLTSIIRSQLCYGVKVKTLSAQELTDLEAFEEQSFTETSELVQSLEDMFKKFNRIREDWKTSQTKE